MAPTKPHPTDPLSDARKATDAYLQAVRIIEVPEGRAALANTSWGGRFKAFAPYDLPVLTEASTLFDGLFDTDVPGVKGYRRLLQASVISAEQIGDERQVPPTGDVKVGKYVAVAYMDAASENWLVFSLRPSTDPAAEIGELREDIELHRFPEAEKAFYRMIAFNQILDGKFGEARMAIDTAKSLPDAPLSDHAKYARKLRSLGANEAQISEVIAQARERDRAFAAEFEEILTEYEAFISAVTAN